MTPRTTLLLVALAVVIAGGGYYLSRPQADLDRPSIAAGTLAFPGLGDRLAQIHKIEIVHQGTTLNIDRDGDRWVLPIKNGYPVQQSRARELVNAFADLKLTEARTSDPAEYNRIGVADPKDAASTSSLVRLLPSEGPPIAELIVGHERVRMQGNVPDTVYVRKPGDAQSWLAEGHMTVDADPQLWIERDVMSIPADQIGKIVAARAAGSVELGRVAGKMMLTAPADHPKIDDDKIDDAFRSLENVSLMDVKPVAEEPGQKLGTTTYTLTDGGTITATGFTQGTGDKAEFWVQFEAAGDGAAKARAEQIEAKAKGWTFQLGSWKESAMMPDLDALKAPPPPATAATPAPSGMPAGLPAGLPPGLQGVLPTAPAETPK